MCACVHACVRACVCCGMYVHVCVREGRVGSEGMGVSLQVHSGCLDTHQKTNPVCTFRDLWGLTLQPAAISHCNIIPLDEDAGTPESAAESKPQFCHIASVQV